MTWARGALAALWALTLTPRAVTSYVIAKGQGTLWWGVLLWSICSVRGHTDCSVQVLSFTEEHTRIKSQPSTIASLSVQFSSVAQLCLTLCDPRNRIMPGLPVHHQHPEFTQTNVHWVGDTVQPSHPLSSPSPPAPNPSQHQGLFQWVNSSHEVAKVLEFQF